MSNIEDLVRDSLRQRAEDVEVTPALWREVDRRIARRRRLQVVVWSVAGATAMVVASLVAPGLLRGADPTPEVEPIGPGPEDGQPAPEGDGEALPPDDEVARDGAEVPAPADDVDEVGPGAGEGAVDGGVVGVSLPEPVLTAAWNRLELIGPTGRTLVHEFPEEGGSIVMGLAVQPGSTIDDYTAAVLTTAEGFWDLRHLHVVDGEVQVPLEPFSRAHQPAPDGDRGTVSVSSPTFAPDGSALLWLEQAAAGGTTLRVVGWDDGPGTGNWVDDNTAIDLNGIAGGVELVDVVASPYGASDGGEGFELRMTQVDGGSSWLRYPLQRQADGAWAAASSASAGEVPVAGDGPIVAIGGTMPDAGDAGDDGDVVRPRWLVRTGQDPIVWDRAASDGPQVDLPEEMFAGEGLPTFWLRPVGDDVLVGTPNTSVTYLYDAAGRLHRLPGEVSWAAAIR